MVSKCSGNPKKRKVVSDDPGDKAGEDVTVRSSSEGQNKSGTKFNFLKC